MSKPHEALPTLSDLSHEACFLAGMIDGLDVLFDHTDSADDSIVGERARNVFRPILEAVIKSAAELSNRIDLVADHATLVDRQKFASE